MSLSDYPSDPLIVVLEVLRRPSERDVVVDIRREPFGRCLRRIDSVLGPERRGSTLTLRA